MKKDLIFAPILVLIGALLWMYKLLGGPAHIAISVLGVLVLAVYTAATKKEWKIPALEIAMRAFYGIALITGIAVMKLHSVAALGYIHKISAVLFLALIIVLLVSKAVGAKKN